MSQQITLVSVDCGSAHACELAHGLEKYGKVMELPEIYLDVALGTPDLDVKDATATPDVEIKKDEEIKDATDSA